MENLIIIIMMFVFGLILNKTKRTKEGDHKIINALLINIFLPSLILKYLHNVDFSVSLFSSASMPWILTGIATAFFIFIGKILNFSKETIGCLILTAGAGNTAFLGLPMVQALFGNSAMPTAIAVDQLGSTPCVLTLGVLIAGFFSTQGQAFNLRSTLKRIISFPPLVATAIAIVTNNMTYSQEFTAVFEKLSACVAPLALLSIGLQFKIEGISENFTKLITGLFFRVFFAPILVSLFLMMTNHPFGTYEKTLLVDSMMGTQITAMIIAQEYKLDEKLAVQMMCFSTPLAILVSVLIFIFL